MLASAMGGQLYMAMWKKTNFLCKLLNVTEIQMQAEPGNCSTCSDKYKRDFNLIQTNLFI